LANLANGSTPSGRRRPGYRQSLRTRRAASFANIHGPNERVLLDESEKATLAEADMVGRLAAASGDGKR